MSFNPTRVRQHLELFDFRELFIEELGWSRPAQRQKVSMQVDDATFERTQIAQLGGVVVYELTTADGVIPDTKMRRSVHAEISKLHHENLIIFLDRERTQSLWYWAKRENGKLHPREHTYMRGQPADLFLQRLSAMVVDISEMDEAGNVAVIEVASKLKDALDVERVTKKFYAAFREQHLAFLEQIKGIDDEHDRRWYASVLLNRLMFIYFLQSKGFIKGHEAQADYKYLQNELKRSRERGTNRYYSEFLDALFFEGFAKPEEKRVGAAKSLIGGVPYLNGGLFLKHGIEARWPDIRVSDAAFENLFRLFEHYSWNLNDTPGGQADEINPDVLGYIFEKYINQKAFGAYYTRTEITQYLCEQTIYKLILDRINAYALPPSSRPQTGELFTVKDHNLFASRRFDTMADLLLNLDAFYCQKLLHDILPDLKLLDPACGSGAFLVAAMKTLTNIYAAVIGKIEFLGDAGLKQWLAKLRREHPSINYYIKKRIITDNLFGVDIMEEATEIAKLRLFLALVASVEKASQLEPLPNIDFNILTGHSLIGLLRIDADEFDQRHAQGNLFSKAYRDFAREMTNDIRVYRQAASFEQDLGALRDNIEEKKREVTATLDEILLDQFGELGIKFEQAAWDEKKNREGKPARRKLAIDDIRHLRPFHWGFEFDDVMNRGGGFDAIITNPPWEIFKPQAKEFFAEYSGLVTKNKMTIKDFEKEQMKLLKKEDVRAAWLEYQSRFPHVSLYFRNAPHYTNQISVVNGKKAGTDINLYKLFLEQCFNLLRPHGRCGIILQSGIYTDLGTKQLREMLFSQCQIGSLFGLSNEKFIFENVHHAQKFCILVFEKDGKTETFEAAFRINPREAIPPKSIGQFLTSPSEHIKVSVPLVRRLSPDSMSIMEFKSATDVHIAEKMLRFPLLGQRMEKNWNFVLTREFDRGAGNSKLFNLEKGEGTLPLFVGKMFHQFTTTDEQPPYWIEELEAREALLGTSEDTNQFLDYQKYRWVHRRIAANTNERTFITTIAPRRVFFDNNSTTIDLEKSGCSEKEMLFLCALCNSFLVDWLLRQKVTTTLNMFYIYQLPAPRLTEEHPEFAFIVERAARLVCTAPEYDELARSVGLADHTAGAHTAEDRAQLRAELDARIAHLYGLTETEFAYVLSTFPLVAPEIKDRALEEFKKEDARIKQGAHRDAEIEQLLRAGESATLEFKSSARWDMRQNKQNKAMEDVIVKTVAAFLNSEQGGALLIGVDDDASIVGLSHDYKTLGKKNPRDAYENFLTTLLLNAYGKDTAALFRITFHSMNGEDVARINVKSAPRPIFIKDASGEHLYTRTGNSTRLLTTREAIEYCKIRWK
jgi:hypothetical protein